MSKGNKLDFVQGVSLQPWEWNNLGAVFNSSKENSQCVAARCNFVIRKGFDQVEQLEYGNVIEALGDVGFNLRSKQYGFHISAANLSYKSGTDAPLRAQSVVDTPLASLKFAYAQELAEDHYVAVSYDFKQRKPELSIAWAGDTFTEKAAVAVSLDPVDRAARVRAVVSFPGPEWRKDVWNPLTQKVETVEVDASSRHTLWAQHELRSGNLLASTQAGGRLDLGRLANLAADLIGRHVEHRIPLLFWKIPLSQRIFSWIIPAEDLDQMRYRIKGWSAELSHDFDRAGPVVGISKRLGSSSTALAASYDTASNTAGVELRAGWVKAAAMLGRQEDGQWRNPAVQLQIQPLAFL